MEVVYNEKELRRIKNIASVDPFQAMTKYKDHVEKYPNDILAKCYYANTLIYLNKLDEANKVIEAIEKNEQEMRRAPSSFINFLTITKIRGYIHSGKIKEAYDLYNDVYEDGYMKRYGVKSTIPDINFKSYCSVKLGLEDNIPKIFKTTYFYQQLVSYHRQRFFKHAEKHKPDFTDDFPMREVIEEITNKDIESIKLNQSFACNSYIFKYDYCGYDKGVLTDYFKVIALEGTKDFLTMYPTENGEFLPHIDLNYLKENNKEEKKVSRIDRFNERYKSFIR